MFLTDFIKHKPFKEFLIEIDAIKKTPIKWELENRNLNPSLTGNAFELFFELALSKKRIEALFQKQFEYAQKNIRNISELKEEYGCLAPKSYNIIKKGLSNLDLVNRTTKPYTKSPVIVEKGVGCLQWLEISDQVIQYIEIIVELKKKTGFSLFRYPGKIFVINQLSVVKYYQQVVKDFAIEADSFTKSRKISKKFTRLILQFSHISHPFFDRYFPLKNTSFVNSYLNYVHELFSSFCQNLPNLKGKITCKPSLAYQKIRATPDFLIGQKIIEVKTSKKPSKQDLLQAIAYLLFAQSKENKRNYGKVESVTIFYAQCNQSISFSLNDLNLNKQSYKILERIIVAFKKDYFNMWLPPKK